LKQDHDTGGNGDAIAQKESLKEGRTILQERKKGMANRNRFRPGGLGLRLGAKADVKEGEETMY